MNKFNTKNFKIVKISGFYRLKFIGKKLPTWNTLIKKAKAMDDDRYYALYTYITKNNNICYIRGLKNDGVSRVFLTRTYTVLPIKYYSKKKLIDANRDMFTPLKQFMKTKQYKEKSLEDKNEYEKYYLAFISLLYPLYKSIKYIIDKCKKLKFKTIIIPFSMQFETQKMGHHNILLIKGNKAWRIEHVYGLLPQVNDYLDVQFKKIGINFQGYAYHMGYQTLCDYDLCGWWSLYIVFYYSINKKMGFDDIFFQSKKVNQEIKYQMHLFLAYIIELSTLINK